VKGTEFAKTVVDGDPPVDFQDGQLAARYFVTRLLDHAVAVAVAVVVVVVGM